MTRGFGWEPDGPDSRDRILTQDALLGVDAVPIGADFSHLLPSVLDQGGENSCVVQSVAAVIWAAHVRAGVDPPVELLSRKALWWLCRHETGRQKFNVGTQLRTAFRLANAMGFCRERHWPHVSDLAKRPSVDAGRMHVDQRFLGNGRVVYERIDDPFAAKLDTMRAALNAGLPFTFGVDVDVDFADGNFDASKPVQPPAGNIAGGHAMVCCGFDGTAFRVRSSWSEDWGDNGNCWFSSAYMMQASDIWTAPSAPPFSDTVQS